MLLPHRASICPLLYQIRPSILPPYIPSYPIDARPTPAGDYIDNVVSVNTALPPSLPPSLPVSCSSMVYEQ